MTRDKVNALFLLSGITLFDAVSIPNGYHKDFDTWKGRGPWWECKTTYGLITIGWRKHVIAIDWSKTNYRGIVTDHDVTKDDTYVHAWSYGQDVIYMTDFNTHLKDITE